MKIIHMADLHLDSRMETFLTPEKARVRQQELLATFMRIVRYAAENEVQAILISGDLFDGESVSPATVRTICDEIASHPKLQFFCLQGNHDSAASFSALSSLPENAAFFDEDWTYYDFPEQKITICGTQAGGKKLSRMAQELSLKPDDFNIVLLHGQAADVYSSITDDLIIPLGVFRNRNIDYLALGHLHSFSHDSLDARGIYCYPGCPEGRGFDECGQHGAVMLDIHDEDHTFDLSFLPFAQRQLYHLRADVSSLTTQEEILNAVSHSLEEGGPREKDLVRISLTGETDLHLRINLPSLRAEFEENYFFFDIKDDTVPFIDYESYRLDASLKGEFVRLVEADPALNEQEKARIIRCGIAALAGEDI